MTQPGTEFSEMELSAMQEIGNIITGAYLNSLATLTSDDHCDIDGDYTDSNSPDIYSRFLAQPTPYVFTAQTWSQEQVFVDSKSTRVEQYSNVFHANQSKEADYKALVADMVNGKVKVSNDSSAEQPSATTAKINFQGNIK